MLRDVNISSLYISKDILFVFMIVVATMYNNVDTLRVVGHLREIGSSGRVGDELCHSLSDSLLSIVNTIARLNDALYSIASYMERKRKQYADGLSYNEVNTLKIMKQHIYTLFIFPRMDDIPENNRPHVSMDWWTFPPCNVPLVNPWML